MKTSDTPEVAEQESHHQGLAHDLDRILTMPTSRRTSLRWLVLGGLGMPLIGCGGGATTSVGSTSSGNSGTGTGTSTGTDTSSCAIVPEETAGPYPGDGTNTNASGIVNVLTMSGIVRQDIRSSFNGASGTAGGIPLTIKLKINNAKTNCAVASGFAVYLWHCDRDGNYSLYSSGVTNQNYLRGVQETDANGELSFVTIFPGCYSGRMPHVHFEVFPTLAKSTSVTNRVKTSQFTFPLSVMNEAYTDSAYATSVRNLAQISFASDNIFSDGTSLQMTSVTGNAKEGYVASLTINVSA
ncbi:intradiol ring-cleavage dioxygenase [Undibacterium fentianense]|uniref:Intradiol ring-cleavage dioxygenase n=1 Tax=Undibacterium fentianense TaxID=2828728 RepID=A0A941E512_9BURK|nr:intradiol ring-cleavage dioxygenase [Undibacterium fentianense]MBR7799858.1 intradiol ring-cleavage dioxygenase [Undibacterium fentianense]